MDLMRMLAGAGNQNPMNALVNEAVEDIHSAGAILKVLTEDFTKVDMTDPLIIVEGVRINEAHGIIIRSGLNMVGKTMHIMYAQAYGLSIDVCEANDKAKDSHPDLKTKVMEYEKEFNAGTKAHAHGLNKPHEEKTEA